jgi:hypothetical protein
VSYGAFVAADLQGYSDKPEAFQTVAQAGLQKVLGCAAERAGLTWDPVDHQPSGDGLLVVMAPDPPRRLLAETFVREVNAELHDHNRLCAEQARLRVRLALHHGPVEPAALGYSGDGPVTTVRLCNGGPLRSALETSGRHLGVIVSETVYVDTFEARKTSMEPTELREVRLPELRRRARAWLWIPGCPDLHGLDFDDGMPGSPPGPAPAAGPAPEPKPPVPGGLTINQGDHGEVVGRDKWTIHLHGGPR